jgi:hypothetical protein
MALPAHSGPSLLFNSVIIFHGRWDFLDEWSARRKVATQTRDNRIHTPNIHTLSGVWTHDPCVRASEDSSCLKTGRLLLPALDAT